MRLTAGMCLKVPNGLDARRAALTEPMTVGLHAVNKSGIKQGEGALVLGCGPVGLAVIAALESKGIEPIVAADFSGPPAGDRDRDGRARGRDARRRSPRSTRGSGSAARSRSCSSRRSACPGIIDQAMRDAPPLSRIVIVGVCMETDHMLPLVGIVKELNLQFTFYYDPIEFGDTLRSIAEGELDVTPMITGVVGVDGVPGRVRRARQPRGAGEDPRRARRPRRHHPV